MGAFSVIITVHAAEKLLLQPGHHSTFSDSSQVTVTLINVNQLITRTKREKRGPILILPLTPQDCR